jgi:hypothetical protein
VKTLKVTGAGTLTKFKKTREHQLHTTIKKPNEPCLNK